ncbi:MAG: hypothetical protein Q9217_006722 [Psora testacea]
MSLYYDTAPLLSKAEGGGSLKSRVFDDTRPFGKSQPKHVYALASEASHWSPLLVEVIETSALLELERRLSPELALLLVHDLLLNKRGVSAPSSHPLRQAVERHKTRLNAEFVKARIKRGCYSREELLARLKSSQGYPVAMNNNILDDEVKKTGWARPRWVRVNVLKTTLEEQMKTTFAGYEELMLLEELLRSQSTVVLHIDKHIPNLIALPPLTDLTRTRAYLDGMIILQDKASCFPACLLSPQSSDGGCVDACAAPGNKTTHLAAILDTRKSVTACPMIYACERDQYRASSLTEMIQKAGAESQVKVFAGQDFLQVDSAQPPWSTVGSLLLDPSCSGSGIVGRDETLQVSLPRRNANIILESSKKRKRNRVHTRKMPKEHPAEDATLDDSSLNQLASRLEALAAFQLKLLLHAFSFPKVRKITYSTCSTYSEENELVVMKGLLSDIARKRGWRILQRDEQIDGLRDWHIRGNEKACVALAGENNEVDAGIVAEACIRCEKGTKEGTQGFFVAAFTRGDDRYNSQDYEEEWEGFSDAA